MQGLENFSLWQSLNSFKTTLFLGMNLSIKVKLTKYKLSPKKKTRFIDLIQLFKTYNYV